MQRILHMMLDYLISHFSYEHDEGIHMAYGRIGLYNQKFPPLISIHVLHCSMLIISTHNLEIPFHNVLFTLLLNRSNRKTTEHWHNILPWPFSTWKTYIPSLQSLSILSLFNFKHYQHFQNLKTTWYCTFILASFWYTPLFVATYLTHVYWKNK